MTFVVILLDGWVFSGIWAVTRMPVDFRFTRFEALLQGLFLQKTTSRRNHSSENICHGHCDNVVRLERDIEKLYAAQLIGLLFR